jgi:hypothetical protein
MKIYIGFSKPIKQNPFAALIEWVEARPYDHAYVRLPEPMDGEYLIFQASGLYVNLHSLENFTNKYQSLKEYEIEIDDTQYSILWRFTKKMLGIPYSLKEDWGILLMKVFHLSKQPFDDGLKKTFCSELSAAVCELLGVSMTEGLSGIDPSALDRRLEDLGLPCESNPKF